MTLEEDNIDNTQKLPVVPTRGKRGPKKGEGGKPKYKRCPQLAERIKKLASVGCSAGSISTIEGVPEMTIRDHYKDELNSFEYTKSQLRAAQVRMALEDNNARMLEWLGKQYLGQSDKTDSSVRGDFDVRQEIAFRVIKSDAQ